MRINLPFFNTAPANETGFQNAKRFVKVVSKLAADERVIIMYPHQGWRGNQHERFGWQWMLNPQWRDLVLKMLADAPVRAPEFHAPDSMDGWTFSAYSTVPVPRIAQLSLGDSL